MTKSRHAGSLSRGNRDFPKPLVGCSSHPRRALLIPMLGLGDQNPAQPLVPGFQVPAGPPGS
jgi:hypothetical protein